MKYIMFKLPTDEKWPIIFPNKIDHICMAKTMQKSFCVQAVLEPISAGFIKKDDDGKMVCTGYSMSMKLSSRDEDTDIIFNKNISPVWSI